MLKGKNSIYVLLPLTFLVWGYISYQVYKTFNSDDVEDLTVTSVLPISKDKPYHDTFTIFNNYRDPFLGESGKELRSDNSAYNRTQQFSKGTSPVNNRNSNNQASKAPVKDEWPQINYSGMIKNQTTSKSVAVIIIGGKTYTLKQGEERDGLKVVTFTSEEIQLSKGKEKRFFTK